MEESKNNKQFNREEAIKLIEKKRKIKKYGISFFVLIIIIGAVWAFSYYNNVVANSPEVLNPNGFTYEQINCLATQHKFYGEEWCPHCNDQKEMLGTEVSDVTYIDCGDNRGLCQDLGITGYPTHIMFNKDTNEMTRIAGVQSIEDILKYTGCYAEQNNVTEHTIKVTIDN